MNTQNDILKEIIKCSKEDLFETTFGDIMNNTDSKQNNDKKSRHQKCNTSILNEEFKNKNLNSENRFDDIYEMLEENGNDEIGNKTHSRHNTEYLEYKRFTNYNNKNEIDDRKTVDLYDNNINIYDDSESEEGDDNYDMNNENSLGAILGVQLDKFNKENNDMILNEEGNNLVNNLKKDCLKYIKTGTKIDFVEDMEGKSIISKRTYRELERYISNLDDDNNENKGEEYIFSSSKKLSKRNLYDILSTNTNTKLFNELNNNKGDIFVFDKNNNIIFCTRKGSILIYNINQEKIVKELDNPFKDESKDKIPLITAISYDEKYIIASYNNGKISLFRKGKEKINKTKLFMTTKEINTKDITIEIKAYSGKKERIIIYLCDKQGKLFRVKIYKGMFKKKMIYKKLNIQSKNNNKLYNLQINPYSYKCIGICNYKSVEIYIIRKNEAKLIFNKTQNNDYNNYNPNFCFVNSTNIKEKSKFMVSISPDCAILYEINSNFTSTIQINKYMFKDPIIKVDIFFNEIIYVLDKEKQITLINCNMDRHRITQKCILGEGDTNLFDIKNFEYQHIKDLYLYKNIICNGNGNIIINSKKKILLIIPMTLKECINNICEKKEKDKWTILFYLCSQIYKNKHPLWTKKNYEECSDLIDEKINNYLNEAINSILVDKVDKLKNIIGFLFNVEKLDYITREKDGLYSKIKDDKLYFCLLEPYILQNKLKSIKLPIILINRMTDFYIKINKKSWLCELLIHLDIKLLCDKNSMNNNGISLIDIFDKNNLINILIYIIINNYDIYKDYSYYSPVVNILFNLIKVSKSDEKGELIKQFKGIISEKEYNQIIIKEDDNNENLKEGPINDFIELNRYNDELLFSNYYLRIKFFWYIYVILFCIEINDNNKKKCQELIDKSLEIILKPKVYEILEENNGNNEILDLNKEIRLIINKLFKDENINKFCEIDKDDILNKIQKLANKKYISQTAYNLICLKSCLDDSTLEINKETKMNLLLFFMKNNFNDYNFKDEINTEKFENDLIELLKNIDSFTFDDTDKVINASNICKDKYPKLYEYININFKKD